MTTLVSSRCTALEAGAVGPDIRIPLLNLARLGQSVEFREHLLDRQPLRIDRQHIAGSHNRHLDVASVGDVLGQPDGLAVAAPEDPAGYGRHDRTSALLHVYTGIAVGFQDSRA